MLWLIYAALVKKDIEPSEHLSQILYTCTMCQNCVAQCKFKFHEYITEILKAAKEEIIDSHQHLVPPMVNKLLTNIYDSGNPYRYPKKHRGQWAADTPIKTYSQGDEFLYYVGCVGSYDPTSQSAAQALGNILVKAGLSFGILGKQEICDGNEAYALGEMGLFEFLREKNTGMFQELGIQKIITLSAHSYHIFTHHYSNAFDVIHYTQILHELLRNGQLTLTKRIEAQVTYHDPCFLGRYNGHYEAPREVLSAIPGIELREMERNRENAFCCGGGGGNFFTDMLGSGTDAPNRVRVREASLTGAAILAVACPVCKLMLEDAVKTEHLENDLVVKDISELIEESLG
jgi:Fe-S oxidoreductase